MAGISTSIYNTFIRRNGIMLSTVFVGAFGFEMAYDTVSTKVWDLINSGRQWKDVKHRYINKEEE